MDHVVCVRLHFKKMPKWLYQFYIPSVCFSSSTPSPALGTVNHFNCRHSSMQVGISHCDFNLHIPNAYDIRHLFHVLIFHPCIFFSDVSVQIIFPFYTGLYVFLLLSFESFNIFWIGKVFYPICDLQMLSPVCILSFIVLPGSFKEHSS